MLNRILGFFFTVCLACQPLRAEIVHDLYAATVPVKDQGESARASASREALAQVLVKVSGNAAVLENPDIKEGLRDARGKVQQYAYRQDESSDSGLAVRFEFDGGLVKDLVTSAGEPLWTANRPPVLVWLAIDDDDGATLVSRDTAAQQTEALLAAFGRRGVPVRLPLLDLQDTAALSAADIQALDRGKLREASARYAVEHIVAARINVLSSGEHVGEWSYLFDDEHLNRPVRGADFDAHLRAGVDAVAMAMASYYAVASIDGEGAGITMSVAGVESYADYAAVLAWLESLEMVDKAKLERVNGARLDLRLDSRAEPAQIPAIIELNPRLRPAEFPRPGVQLDYVWRAGE